MRRPLNFYITLSPRSDSTIPVRRSVLFGDILVTCVGDETVRQQHFELGRSFAELAKLVGRCDGLLEQQD